MNNPNAAANLKPFKNGDHRINRKGRPKDFRALRELALAIAHEEARLAGQPMIINGYICSVAEAILRSWANSRNPRLQMAFIEVAFGKVPDSVEVSGKDGEPVKVIFINMGAEEEL